MRVLEHDGDGGVVQLEVGNRLIVGFGKPGNPAQSASSAFEVAYSERGVQVFLHGVCGREKGPTEADLGAPGRGPANAA